jgi:hypothetical protein
VSRWTTGLGPWRALVPRFGAAAASAGPAGAGPVYLLSSDATESARLAASVDMLSGGERDQATVVVPPGAEQSRGLWKQLASVLEECRRSGIVGVRLLWAGGGADLPGRPAPARRISDSWQMDVIAPAGPVVVAPGGSLFAPPEAGGSGGWWRFTPGLSPQPLGLRHPVPSWEDAAARLTLDAVRGYVVEPVPAGVLIRIPEPVSDAALAVGASIPVDEHRLAVVVGMPGTPSVPAGALAELLAILPLRARAAARLVPGDGGDLLATCQETADLLGTEVAVVSGLPALLERFDGAGAESAVVLIGADGEPSWRPYVEAVACLPAHGRSAVAPRILQWRPPVDGLAAGPESGVLLLDALWQVSVTRAGLWVGPRGGRPEEYGWALDPETMVLDVGVPGQRLDDGLWPVLDALLEGLEPSVRERTTLQVLGSCSVQGRRLLRRVTEQRGFALEYGEDVPSGRGSEGVDARLPEPERRRAPARSAPQGTAGHVSAQAASHEEAHAPAPWHASPMSVRVRRVAAPPSPVPDSPAAPAPSAARAPRPPGFTEALAASRSAEAPVGRSAPAPSEVTRTVPVGRSVPVPWEATRIAPVEVPTGRSVPAPSETAGAAPVPPVSPEVPPPSPEPTQVTAPEHTPVPTAAARRPAPSVLVTPLHRSSSADRQALRALAGEPWWQYLAEVTRTLAVTPGLRMQFQSEDVRADLIAVRCYLTLDDGPLSWTWLARQLESGSGDAFPFLSCLASGLRRLPSYRGVVVRDAGVLPPEARSLSPGRELCEAGPVGTFALDGAPPAAADRYLIWSVTGRRVRNMFASPPWAGSSDEVVFAPGTRFRVLGTQGQPGAMAVLLREVADGDPVARAGGYDAEDRGALERLREAVGRSPAAGDAASWPARLTGQLAANPPDRTGNP